MLTEFMLICQVVRVPSWYPVQVGLHRWGGPGLDRHQGLAKKPNIGANKPGPNIYGFINQGLAKGLINQGLA